MRTFIVRDEHIELEFKQPDDCDIEELYQLFDSIAVALGYQFGSIESIRKDSESNLEQFC